MVFSRARMLAQCVCKCSGHRGKHRCNSIDSLTKAIPSLLLLIAQTEHPTTCTPGRYSSLGGPDGRSVTGPLYWVPFIMEGAEICCPFLRNHLERLSPFTIYATILQNILILSAWIDILETGHSWIWLMLV